MKNSELLWLFAKANRKCGYDDYAQDLEDAALVHEAEEILEPRDYEWENRNG